MLNGGSGSNVALMCAQAENWLPLVNTRGRMSAGDQHRMSATQAGWEGGGVMIRDFGVFAGWGSDFLIAPRDKSTTTLREKKDGFPKCCRFISVWVFLCSWRWDTCVKKITFLGVIRHGDWNFPRQKLLNYFMTNQIWPWKVNLIKSVCWDSCRKIYPWKLDGLHRVRRFQHLVDFLEFIANCTFVSPHATQTRLLVVGLNSR